MRPYAGPGPIHMSKVKVEDNPLPGLKFPRGAKLERGAGAGGGAGAGTGANAAPSEPDVSVMALAKRVGADQLGM